MAPPRGPGPEEADEWPRWRVRHTAAPNTGAGAVHAGEEKEDEFDVVVVANGHYEVPAVPGEVPAEWRLCRRRCQCRFTGRIR